MKLNKETAQEYVLQHLTELGYEDVVIHWVCPIKKVGEPPLIDVTFSYADQFGEDGRSNRHTFTVWLESGKLYGEW